MPISKSGCQGPGELEEDHVLLTWSVYSGDVLQQMTQTRPSKEVLSVHQEKVCYGCYSRGNMILLLRNTVHTVDCENHL